jgi:hypothetical protein
VSQPSSGTASDGVINLLVGAICPGHETQGNQQLFLNAPYADVFWHGVNTATGQAVNSFGQNLTGVGPGIYTATITRKPTNSNSISYTSLSIQVVLSANNYTLAITPNSINNTAIIDFRHGGVAANTSITQVKLNGVLRSLANSNTLGSIPVGFNNLVITTAAGDVVSQYFYMYRHSTLTLNPVVVDDCVGTSSSVTP